MTAQKRPSCLLRVVSGGITMAFGMIASALFLLFLFSLYPRANPVLYGLLEDNNIPLAADFVWAFWSTLPCLFGLVASFLVGMGVNWVVRRIAGR